MDIIGGIVSFLGDNWQSVITGNWTAIVTTILAGGTIFLFYDKIIEMLLKQFMPELIKWILDNAKDFDDNVIDKFKKKYPASGKEIEDNLVILLDKLKKIIKDE